MTTSKATLYAVDELILIRANFMKTDGEAWWLEHWKGGISSLPLLVPKKLHGDTNMAISRGLCGHQNTEMNGEVMYYVVRAFQTERIKIQR